MNISPKCTKDKSIIGFCLLLLAATSVHAQTAAGQQPPVLAQQVTLENEPTLAVLVSFESQRKPLGKLLTELSIQTKTTLSVTDNALRDRLVTARIKQVPLSQVMSSLARLYGATWDKAEQGFELHAQPRTNLETMQLQSAGGYSSFRAVLDYLTNEEDFEALRKDIIDEWAAKNTQKFAPLPINQLSQDVQDRLRHVLMGKSITQIIDRYTKATEQLTPESNLTFARENDGIGNRFTIGMVSAKKNGLGLFSPIYSPFVLNKPQPMPDAAQPAQPQQQP